MNIPGFTAESAIRGARGNYEMESANGFHLGGAGVTPQTVDCDTACTMECEGLPKQYLFGCFTNCLKSCKKTGTPRAS